MELGVAIILVAVGYWALNRKQHPPIRVDSTLATTEPKSHVHVVQEQDAADAQENAYLDYINQPGSYKGKDMLRKWYPLVDIEDDNR